MVSMALSACFLHLELQLVERPPTIGAEEPLTWLFEVMVTDCSSLCDSADCPSVLGPPQPTSIASTNAAEAIQATAYVLMAAFHPSTRHAEAQQCPWHTHYYTT